MTSSRPDEPSSARSSSAEAEMARYGIERVPVDRFDYGGFRYSTLKDAIAEAKRRAAREGRS